MGVFLDFKILFKKTLKKKKKMVLWEGSILIGCLTDFPKASKKGFCLTIDSRGIAATIFLHRILKREHREGG